MSDKETEPTKVNLEALKQPKVLIAGAIAALGGLLYAGDGFTIEFSTCTVEEPAPTLEIIPIPEPAKDTDAGND
jgi:hypothetical protein